MFYSKKIEKIIDELEKNINNNYFDIIVNILERNDFVFRLNLLKEKFFEIMLCISALICTLLSLIVLTIIFITTVIISPILTAKHYFICSRIKKDERYKKILKKREESLDK